MVLIMVLRKLMVVSRTSLVSVVIAYLVVDL